MVNTLAKNQFETLNPATKKLLGTFSHMTKEEVNDQIDKAAAYSPAWKMVSAPERAGYLAKVADCMEKERKEWANLITEEAGKCTREAEGEVSRAITMLRFFSGEGFRMTGATIPSQQSNVHAFTKQQPLGTVGIITPWNVPLAIPIWKMAPAIVAGNTVVWKPANQTLLISQKLMETFEKAGLPEGTVKMVVGVGSLVGEALTSHPAIKAISFTGSNKTGLAINQAAAVRGIRFQAEMGGKNPMIILPDADLDLAVSDIIAGGLLDAGQRCSATSRVFVHDDVYEAVKERLVSRLENLKVGLPSNPDTQIGPVADQLQYDTIRRYIEIAKKEGGKLIFGGQEPNEDWFKQGYFIMPSVFENVTQDMTLAKEEVFGPVLAFMRFSDLEECLKQANSVHYGLSSSIYTNDLSKAYHYIENIESGLVHVNLPSAYSEPHMPFGGIKSTGIGGFREQGQQAIQFYTEWKTVFMKV